MRFSRVASPAWALWVSQAAAATTPYPSTPLDVDVAIIGGGSAGIHAAIHLKDAGAKVVVIEQKSQIGGHAETYINPQTGVPANIGVVLFENREIVSNYFSRLNVPTAKVNPISSAGPSQNWDFSLGIPIPALNATAAAASQLTLAAAAQAYSVNVLAKYPWIDGGFLVPDPVPEELTVTFGELAEKYNFSALLPVIGQFNWYTGDVSAIPALYGIKGLGPGLLNSLFGEFIVSGTGDTRALYDSAARELGDSVLLDASVLKVDRNIKLDEKTASGVTVLVQQPGQTAKLVRARKLLVAIPPTLENVATYDLTSHERSLFSKFSALGYWAAVATIPGLNTSLANFGIQTPFNQPVVPGTNGINSAGSPNDFLIALGFEDTNYSDADAQALFRKNLATLAAGGAVPQDAAEKVTFPYFSNHKPYNVRVSAKLIKSGFYRKLLALEGTRNTYWAGATFSGHNSALVWSFNEGTVLPGLKKDLGL